MTAEGVDLNRNFVDFAEPLPQTPGMRSWRSIWFLRIFRKRVFAAQTLNS